MHAEPGCTRAHTRMHMHADHLCPLCPCLPWSTFLVSSTEIHEDHHPPRRPRVPRIGSLSLISLPPAPLDLPPTVPVSCAHKPALPNSLPGMGQRPQWASAGGENSVGSSIREAWLLERAPLQVGELSGSHRPLMLGVGLKHTSHIAQPSSGGPRDPVRHPFSQSQFDLD